MIEYLTYKKKPILLIKNDTNNLVKISFGIKKAKLILENMEAIKKFVEKYEQKVISSSGEYPTN